MRHLVERTSIHAPIERVFALSTNLELVRQTLGMRLVSGPASGSVLANSRVHWRGWKFGLPTSHHTLITRFEPPREQMLRFDGHEVIKTAFFQDSQEKGRFAAFHHDHYFRQYVDGGPVTLLEDQIFFRVPAWMGGALSARFLLEPHIRQLAEKRFAMLKDLAEGSGWRRYVAV